MDAAGLIELCEQQWYDTVESLIEVALRHDSSTGLTEARNLASIAHRVMSLDAEDFELLSEQGPAGAQWTSRVASSCFPHHPRSTQRGALASLVPLYELMLEVIQVRARRGEPQSLVVTAHLIGEYLCQLAWEQRLGHGGDPLQMRQSVGERWGSSDPSCPHTSAMKSTAKRALNAANGDEVGFTRYLDKFHSRLGDTLAVCAMNHQTLQAGNRPDVGPTCPNPCQWAVAGDLDERRDLDARLRLALIYLDSPLVALRHHAPVGHFFGVPSLPEIAEAWQLTWAKLTLQWADGCNPLVAAINDQTYPMPDDEALPGLSMLVSVVAGRAVRPGGLLLDIGADVVAALRVWEQSAG